MQNMPSGLLKYNKEYFNKILLEKGEVEIPVSKLFVLSELYGIPLQTLVDGV